MSSQHPTDPLTTATNFITYLNTRQYNHLPTVLHPNFLKHFPSHLDKAPADTAAFLAEYQGLASQLPDMKSEIIRSTVSETGDEVWLWTRIEGLPEGFEMEIVEICKVQDGRVREKWDVIQTGRKQ